MIASSLEHIRPTEDRAYLQQSMHACGVGSVRAVDLNPDKDTERRCYVRGHWHPYERLAIITRFNASDIGFVVRQRR